MAGAVSLMAVVFTDLVGSTELRARVGEEAAEEVRRALFALLRDAVTASQGEEVKTLGDGIMAAFPNPSAAFACAVAMQQGLVRHNRRRSDQALAIRVGVSAGEVTSEEGDYFGTPVVEAARLCAAAQGGQILVSELAARLAVGRVGVALEPVGTLSLKGLPEPVATLTVKWEPDRASSIPLPAYFESQRHRYFVGRVHERRLLADALKAAAEGDRQMVLVAGEPGIGKTRLVSQAALDAEAGGVTVLYGRCGEELGFPYRPVVEALRSYVTACSAGVLAVHARAHGGELARLVPEMEGLVPGLQPPHRAEPDTERFLLFEAVAGLLSQAAQDGPLMMVLDDLHWADRATVTLVDHLIRWAPPMPLVVVGTYRDSDLTREHPLTNALADWRRDSTVHRLVLRGLSDTDAVDLVSLAAGHELDEAGVLFAHAARRETDGSPFFLVEILRHLREIGALRVEDGRWRYQGDPARLGVPESVREVIGRRVHRLSEPAGRVLGHASVIGREFDLPVLASVLNEPEEQVLEGLEEALAARLVGEVVGSPWRFSFAHALVRQTLYEQFSAARRLQLHRRVAETLEKTFGSDAPDHLPELAHHWLNAVPPAVAGADRRKAVDYAQRAARRAMGALAYEQAAGHCEAALDVLTADDAVLRGELLTELGEARWRSGDITGAREAFGQAAVVARGLDDGELLARAALGYGVGLGGAGTAVQADPTLLSLLDEALCAIGEADQPLRVRLLGRLAVELYWTDETDRREAVGREAVAAAQRLGDPAVEIVALYSRHWSMLGPDGIGERQAATDDLVRIAEAIGDGEMAFRGHYMRLRTALEMGDITAADNALERCSALAGELRQPFYAWQTLVFRATNAISEGHVAEGGILAREAFETGQRVAPQAATSVFGAHMAMYHLLKGTVDEMLPRIRDRVANLPDEPIWRGFLVWSCAEAGHLDEARVNFQAMAAKGFGCMRRNGNWIATVHFLGRACGLLDAADAAAFLYGLLLPYQGRSAIGSNGGYRDSSVDGSLGSLAAAMGRLDDAARHFEEALRRDAASRSRGFMVVTSRDYARMLLRRRAPGDLERAGEVIAQALLTARNAGMSTLARQLIELQA